MIIKGTLGRLLAVGAVTGGAAALLFGGSAVETQFSATSTQNVTISGARVSEALTDGSFTCSNLLPGGPACQHTVTYTNTSTVPVVVTITFGVLTGTPSALGDPSAVIVSVPKPGGGTVTFNGSQYTTNPIQIGTAPVGATYSVPVSIGLLAGTGNAWNNATVDVPYTVTATAGS